jgi:hypothetical protein
MFIYFAVFFGGFGYFLNGTSLWGAILSGLLFASLMSITAPLWGRKLKARRRRLER